MKNAEVGMKNLRKGVYFSGAGAALLGLPLAGFTHYLLASTLTSIVFLVMMGASVPGILLLAYGIICFARGQRQCGTPD